jgi:hypothetical protein
MTYKIQIDDLVRDATSEEAEAIEANKVQALAKEEAEAAKAAAAASAVAKLEAIGLTAEEIAALRG